MKKIQTIFKRDFEGNRKVVNEYIDGSYTKHLLQSAIATEKLDGMNVRITVRSNIVVRAEKRRNPSNIQKKDFGMVDPWYVDACQDDPNDKYIFDGIANTDFSEIKDGEWSGELIGKNIQGNPLQLEKNFIVFFSLGQAPVFSDCPITYEGLKDWLKKTPSKIGTGIIEGIVWKCNNGQMLKIKGKDF